MILALIIGGSTEFRVPSSKLGVKLHLLGTWY
jgi:hypothetical protein